MRQSSCQGLDVDGMKPGSLCDRGVGNQRCSFTNKGAVWKDAPTGPLGPLHRRKAISSGNKAHVTLPVGQLRP